MDSGDSHPSNGPWPVCRAGVLWFLVLPTWSWWESDPRPSKSRVRVSRLSKPFTTPSCPATLDLYRLSPRTLATSRSRLYAESLVYRTSLGPVPPVRFERTLCAFWGRGLLPVGLRRQARISERCIDPYFCGWDSIGPVLCGALLVTRVGFRWPRCVVAEVAQKVPLSRLMRFLTLHHEIQLSICRV